MEKSTFSKFNLYVSQWSKVSIIQQIKCYAWGESD